VETCFRFPAISGGHCTRRHCNTTEHKASELGGQRLLTGELRNYVTVPESSREASFQTVLLNH
jgi:hypothetical protein